MLPTYWLGARTRKSAAILVKTSSRLRAAFSWPRVRWAQPQVKMIRPLSRGAFARAVLVACACFSFRLLPSRRMRRQRHAPKPGLSFRAMTYRVRINAFSTQSHVRREASEMEFAIGHWRFWARGRRGSRARKCRSAGRPRRSSRWRSPVSNRACACPCMARQVNAAPCRFFRKPPVRLASPEIFTGRRGSRPACVTSGSPWRCTERGLVRRRKRL